VNGLGLAQAPPEQIEVPLWGGNPLCGFLLEHVEHIQDALKAHGIDGAVGVAIEVVANLDNSTAEAFEWLRVGGMVAELHFEKRLADFAPDFYWEFPRSFRLGPTNTAGLIARRRSSTSL